MSVHVYEDEPSWRGRMLAGQIGVRQSIGELGFLIAGLFLAYLLSDFMPTLAIVVAAFMCAGAMYTIWREARAGQRLNDELDENEALQR